MPLDRLGHRAAITYKSLERKAKGRGAEDGIGVTTVYAALAPFAS